MEYAILFLFLFCFGIWAFWEPLTSWLRIPQSEADFGNADTDEFEVELVEEVTGIVDEVVGHVQKGVAETGIEETTVGETLTNDFSDNGSDDDSGDYD